jgi:hypothetical protein
MYQDKANLMHPLNPIQEQQFNIPIDELLLMSYNIRKHGRDQANFIYKEQKHTMPYHNAHKGRSFYYTQRDALQISQLGNKVNVFPANPKWNDTRLAPPLFRKTGLNSI